MFEYRVSPGFSAWQAELVALATNPALMDEDSLQECFEEIEQDMEDQLQIMSYVSEQFEEFLAEERANESGGNARMEQMLQQKCAASLASRI